MAKEKILVVDDEKSMRDFLSIMLKKEGYTVTTSATAEKGLMSFNENGSDLVIADMKMPGMGGIEMLRSMKEESAHVPVIMITAYASVDTAIEAMKAGAYDYFTKPFNIDEVKLHVKRALVWRRLEIENERLKGEIRSIYGFKNFVGSSQKMAEIYKLIMSVAGTRTNVLITGESGTGKELVARAVHSEGVRGDGPFVSINCGAIPENLLESELFGYQRGAFTGAVSNKAGLAEEADGGTLFLDEISELPLGLQVKLLRFIQERSFRRVGGLSDITVDIRLVTATNKDLEAEVEGGRFREDLFYRLNVVRIEVPPLRDRMGDLPALIRHFVDKYNGEQGKSVKGVSEEAMEALMAYEYAGNVRELENAVESAMAVEAGDHIGVAGLPAAIRRGASAAVSPLAEVGVGLETAVVEFEKSMVMEALKQAGGVKKKAAELLGISFRSLRYKLEKYDSPDDR